MNVDTTKDNPNSTTRCPIEDAENKALPFDWNGVHAMTAPYDTEHDDLKLDFTAEELIREHETVLQLGDEFKLANYSVKEHATPAKDALPEHQRDSVKTDFPVDIAKRLRNKKSSKAKSVGPIIDLYMRFPMPVATLRTGISESDKQAPLPELDIDMTPADFLKLSRGTPRMEIIDPMATHAISPKSLRGRLLWQLRLLEDDVRTMQNNRVSPLTELVTPTELKHYGSVLNAIAWVSHSGLIATLRQIKHGDSAIIEDFHQLIDNLGYLGGYSKKDGMIRLSHTKIPVGYIVV